MSFLILSLFCLSLITAFTTKDPTENITRHFAAFILRSILCLCVLAVSDFAFLSLLSGTGNLMEIISEKQGVCTPDDLCLSAAVFLFQVVICAAVVMVIRLIDCHKKGVSVHLFSKRQEHVFCILLFISFAFMGISVSVKSWSETQILISEVSSTGSKEEHENTEAGHIYDGDYVELYNPTPFNINLSHFYITDDPGKQSKQVSAKDIIPAGGYAIVRTEQGDNNFSVSNNGDEVICLLNSDGKILDSVTVPVLRKGTVYARDNSESGWGIHDPSPLEENSGNEIRPVSAPDFSAESGFYDEPFTLKLTASDGCRIYYTTDGSEPGEDSIPYEDGFEIRNASEEPNVFNAVQNVRTNWQTYKPPADPVDKAAIIRAVAIDTDGNRSEVVTRTYFMDLDRYRDKYVISLVANEKDLFGADGIFVTGDDYDAWYLNGQNGKAPAANFTKSGIGQEVETYMEMFHDDLLMSQYAGMRVQGESSRTFSRKGIKLYSRKRYSGSYYFDYDIFGEPIHSFNIRNGNGNDGFTDSFIQSLVPDRGIGVKKSIPVTVFLNGEYWYDYYLTERNSEAYIAQKFNVDRHDVTIETSMPKDIRSFLRRHDLSEDEDYLLFGELVDIQNYIDYMVDNIYLCNMDLDETKNLKMWRTEGNTGIGYDDGKWRFLTHDMDAIAWNNNNDFYGSDSYGINSFSSEKRYGEGTPFDEGSVFSALKNNEDFCRRFVLTFMDFANTYFEKDNVGKQLVEWGKDISWCDGFFEKRFDYIVPDMAQEFDLTGSLEKITLKTDQAGSGTITINTVTPDLTGGEWSGYYYTDYPVTLYAAPAEGYEFRGWRHGDDLYEDPAIEVELSNDDNVWEAVFAEEN